MSEMPNGFPESRLRAFERPHASDCGGTIRFERHESGWVRWACDACGVSMTHGGEFPAVRWRVDPRGRRP